MDSFKQHVKSATEMKSKLLIVIVLASQLTFGCKKEEPVIEQEKPVIEQEEKYSGYFKASSYYAGDSGTTYKYVDLIVRHWNKSIDKNGDSITAKYPSVFNNSGYDSLKLVYSYNNFDTILYKAFSGPGFPAGGTLIKLHNPDRAILEYSFYSGILSYTEYYFDGSKN